MNCKKIAAMIVEKLKAEGFELLRYDAFGSNSIYLKLDYGVTGSIRISDHKGKKKLKYRFNVRTDYKQSRYDEKEKRYFYCSADVDQIINDVVAFRAKLIDTYGEDRYQEYMRINQQENKDRRGFWQEGRKV